MFHGGRRLPGHPQTFFDATSTPNGTLRGLQTGMSSPAKLHTGLRAAVPAPTVPGNLPLQTRDVQTAELGSVQESDPLPDRHGSLAPPHVSPPRAVDISPPPIPRSVWSVPPAGGLDSSWSKPAAASTNVTCGEDVPGHAGAGSSGSPAPRRGKLAILVPLWRADGDVALLVANLAALLDSQGFVNYHIHIIEQHPAASFKPGLLVDVGFSVAEETQGLKPTDTVVYQQPRVQPEPCVCYALPPHTPFMHLASAQSFMGYRTPYVGYCGGAWAMRVDLFRRVRGMATQYTGYEGLEDDLCRRVEQELQMGSLPALPLPWGRFDSQSDVEVVYRLAKLHRGQNQDLYRSRWQANRENPREVADAVAGTAADGMHALPEGWRERVAIREEGPHHTWWLLRLFPDQEALLASKEEFDGSGAAKDGAGDASVSGDGLSAPNDLSAQSVTDDAEDRLA